jgi:hypothetical protein
MYICKKNTPSGGTEWSERGKPSSCEATVAARAPRLKRRQKPRCTGCRLPAGRAGIYLRPNLAWVPLALRARLLLHCPVDSQQQLLLSPNLQQPSGRAAHEQMVDLTRASSNPPASSIGINLLVLSPVKICCDEICIVILLSVLRSFFWLSQNYSAGKLLVILGVEWQNIFLCSCNQFNFWKILTIAVCSVPAVLCNGRARPHPCHLAVFL